MTRSAGDRSGPAAALYTYALTLRRPLETGHGRLAQRRGLLLCLRDPQGLCGWGDAAPMGAWYGPDMAATSAALTDWLRSTPLSGDLAAPAALADLTLRDVPCAWAAVGGALADLAARREGLPLAAALSGAAAAPSAAPPAVPTAALVDGDTPEQVASAGAAAVARGFGTFKLKVGNRPLATDVARVAALRAVIPPDAALRLDANGAWGSAAAAGIEAVAPFRPELLEEPCHGLDELRRLQATTDVPLAVDESLPALADLHRHLPLGVAAAVLKPSALGSPPAVLAAVAALRAGGTEVVVSSFLDSAVGVATAAHVAAAVPAGPAAGPAAGLDTSVLLAADVCEPPAVRGGALWLPAGPGLGLAPEPARLAALASGAP